MKNLKFLVPVLCMLLLAWCEINLQFKSDWEILNNAIEKISYLYNNCMTDLEWIEDVMTPESMANMDETCKASIKTMKKIRSTIEKLKWKIWESQMITLVLNKINWAISSLENWTNQITNIYNQIENWSSNIDFEKEYSEIISNMKNENVTQVLSNIQEWIQSSINTNINTNTN